MIPKAGILRRAKREDLLPTTVEKDYALGWVLYGIAQHAQACQWVFKGGTSLKKCFFNTYRFSEDLDFTIPAQLPYGASEIANVLAEVGDWVENVSGIRFPADGISVDEYPNPRGNTSFQVKLTFSGPLQMSRRELQRVKLDLTNDEVIADTPVPRAVNHPYEDKLVPAPEVLCYSVNEILAEKSRALYERRGRARDVYDVVHIARVFRDSVNTSVAGVTLRKKFDFKGLPQPNVQMIVDRIDADLLRANWNGQLAHQLPVLPDVDGFIESLPESLRWWIDPSAPAADVPPAPGNQGERTANKVTFVQEAVARRIGLTPSALERITFAARNRLCVRITYKGVQRTVEPYSIRYPRNGNTLLYVWELDRAGAPTNRIKAYSMARIQDVDLSAAPFTPRYAVEL